LALIFSSDAKQRMNRERPGPEYHQLTSPMYPK
jgi:hypothetical protein